ncbi:hypothetical protein [Chromobacterium phragmitis]|uniref:hypothetical protein n=1 Tax=Chromobacterium phragmitis TaxID=2202141 RepID=UPI0032660503
MDRLALRQALLWQPGLSVEARIEGLLGPLRRLDEMPLSLADRLHALKAVYEACQPLLWRGGGADSDVLLRGLWRELHEACKLLAQACAARRAGRFGDGGLLRQALGVIGRCCCWASHPAIGWIRCGSDNCWTGWRAMGRR